MAFIVEDGSGLTTSNAFISVVYFTEHHTDRGRNLIDSETEETFTDEKIQAAIVLASDFIEAKFEFVGYRRLSTQAMEWPRYNAFYNDGRVANGVPVEVRECVAELAYHHLQGVELAPNPDYDDSLIPVQRRREKVGEIEEDVSFRDGGAPLSFKAYPFAEKRMKELLVTGRFVERV